MVFISEFPKSTLMTLQDLEISFKIAKGEFILQKINCLVYDFNKKEKTTGK